MYLILSRTEDEAALWAHRQRIDGWVRVAGAENLQGRRLNEDTRLILMDDWSRGYDAAPQIIGEVRRLMDRYPDYVVLAHDFRDSSQPQPAPTHHMGRAFDVPPANIAELEHLVIRDQCDAMQVYLLIKPYPNLKQVTVNGRTYSRQHISQMEPNVILGDSPLRIESAVPTPAPTQGAVVWADEPLPDPLPAPEGWPPPPAVWTATPPAPPLTTAEVGPYFRGLAAANDVLNQGVRQDTSFYTTWEWTPTPADPNEQPPF